MDGLPWWAHLTLRFWTDVSILFRWAAGALIVCRRDAFQAVGGFDQDLYALDEIRLSKQLKRWGRRRGLQFTILTSHPSKHHRVKSPLFRPGDCRSDLPRIFVSKKDVA